MELDGMNTLANIISFLTVFSSLFLKLPQIKSMCDKESSEGIYVQTMVIEIIGFSIMTLYNFTNGYTLMTYLEYPIILIQVYVMTYFCLKYKGLLGCPAAKVVPVAYFISVALFALEIISKTVLSYLVPLCTPLSGFAKVTYIYGIIKSGNANAISLVTWIISVLTNLSRVYTVYMDSGDKKLILNFVVSALLSGAVLLTALSYQLRGRSLSPSNRMKRRRRSSARKYD